jgi:hypothetical protein
MNGMGVSRRGFVIGIAAMALSGTAFARSESAASAKMFLQQIYASYLGNSSQAAKGIALADAATVRRYFSPGLASLILDDGTAAKKRGEPPALDGDPFVGAQDWDISDLSIDVKEAGAKATGTVSFVNGGKPEKIVLELLKVGDDWRITDIHWDSGTLRGLYRGK